MARIQNRYLFSWQEVVVASDLNRLKFVIENLKNEELMRVLEKERE
jgi:hypothetical protein